MKMPLQAICISQLSDGWAGKAIDSALGDVTKDIAERGSDGKARKVTITLSIKPEGQGYGEVDVQVQKTVPPLRPPTTKVEIDERAGAMIFNPDCSGNPDQQTFNDIPGLSGMAVDDGDDEE